jgi:hypothetical protein
MTSSSLRIIPAARNLNPKTVSGYSRSRFTATRSKLATRRDHGVYYTGRLGRSGRLLFERGAIGNSNEFPRSPFNSGSYIGSPVQKTGLSSF